MQHYIAKSNAGSMCYSMPCRSLGLSVLMGKRKLIALLNLSSWCLVMVEQLFLAVPRGCLQFVIVVFPDHTHLLFLVGILSGVDSDHGTGPRRNSSVNSRSTLYPKLTKDFI